ncbi:MAG TPA: hypothetical protein VEH79_04405 [Gaiellaceae bacterium]|nr:hypothetical protein [Gaiellaceae bacterium]
MPDPGPGVHRRAHLVSYAYSVPAVNQLTGLTLRGWHFRCVVFVDGQRSCELVVDLTSGVPVTKVNTSLSAGPF